MRPASAAAATPAPVLRAAARQRGGRGELPACGALWRWAPCCGSGGIGGSPAAAAEGGAAAGTLGEAVAWELEDAGDVGGGGGGGPAGGAARWGMRAVGSTAARAGSVMRGAQRMGVLGARVRPAKLCSSFSVTEVLDNKEGDHVSAS